MMVPRVYHDRYHMSMAACLELTPVHIGMPRTSNVLVTFHWRCRNGLLPWLGKDIDQSAVGVKWEPLADGPGTHPISATYFQLRFDFPTL